MQQRMRNRTHADTFAPLSGKVDKMMPTLGFDPERDNDRLVASFSGGWQMRMGLGKILLQEPDLLLLDEPTNHVRVAWLRCATLALTLNLPRYSWMSRRLSGWSRT